jgi:hypothetical protein
MGGRRPRTDRGLQRPTLAFKSLLRKIRLTCKPKGQVTRGPVRNRRPTGLSPGPAGRRGPVESKKAAMAGLFSRRPSERTIIRGWMRELIIE